MEEFAETGRLKLLYKAQESGKSAGDCGLANALTKKVNAVSKLKMY